MIRGLVRLLPEPLQVLARRAYHAARGWPAWTPDAQRTEEQAAPDDGLVQADPAPDPAPPPEPHQSPEAAPAAEEAAEPAQPRSRSDILLAAIDRSGLGLEIGPSHSPIAPRRDGFRVEIIDHANREQLVEKYRAHGVDVDAIEEVDFIWDGRGYAELTGRPNGYDWIIASHVIEHTPDLVGFLRDCEAILRHGGVLSLAVPDKRVCFDRMRAMTSIQAVVDAHLEGRANHTEGRVADYFLNVVALDGRITWVPNDIAGRSIDALGFVHDTGSARKAMATIRGGVYLDIHAWVFTPSSFRLLLSDLHLLGLTGLREASFTPGDTEFFVTLSRDGQGPGIDRMELLRRIDSEQGESILPEAGAHGR